MKIAGGCYREICAAPHWDALYGSGGRAAACMATVAHGVELHTYLPPDLRVSLRHLEALGVEVHAKSSATAVAFAYLYPLSTPVIAPSTISKESPLTVSGSSVLRFGFLEGDAIVHAKRAVYDPQTRPTGSFAQNGSRADELALVLNEHELTSAVGTTDLALAASTIRKQENAAIVVAKCGANPITVALLTAAGADSFDGLEWCRYVVDARSRTLHHFQLYELFKWQDEVAISPVTQAAWSDNKVSYTGKAIFHNLDFYSTWFGNLRRAVKDERRLVEFMVKLLPEEALDQARACLPGVL